MRQSTPSTHQTPNTKDGRRAMDSNGVLVLAYVLIGLGFLLLLAELIFPSGILSALSLGAIIIGLALTFSHSATTGLVTLVAVFIILPTLGSFVLRVWPKTALGKRLFLKNRQSETTLAETPVNQQLEQLTGRYGKTVSPLRPSGVTNFD